MKIAQLLLLACLSSAPALADESGTAGDSTALDLSLPATRLAAVHVTPGARYEDFPRQEVASAPDASLCPVSPSGESREVTGSVTTGMGYSSRGDNSTFNATTINWCKESVDEDGDASVINVNISLDQYDGSDTYGGDRAQSTRPRPSRGRARR